MKVYHGSNVRIETIDLKRCRNNLDFGKGFYTTSIKAHAVTWAQKVAERRNSQPVVTEFEFWEGVFRDRDFQILRFSGPSPEWVEFVVLNRKSISQPAHNFDIVEGPIADDWVTNQINLYVNGEITMDHLIKGLTYREPTHQICFCTVLSLQALKTINEGDSNPAWNAQKIANALCDALVGEQGMDMIKAQSLLYLSDTFAKLTNPATGFHTRPWTEIYKLFKQEMERKNE
jgi:hypothetical protein